MNKISFSRSLCPKPVFGLQLSPLMVWICTCFQLSFKLPSDIALASVFASHSRFPESLFSIPRDVPVEQNAACGGNGCQISRHDKQRDIIFNATSVASLAPINEQRNFIPSGPIPAQFSFLLGVLASQLFLTSP